MISTLDVQCDEQSFFNLVQFRVSEWTYPAPQLLEINGVHVITIDNCVILEPLIRSHRNLRTYLANGAGDEHNRRLVPELVGAIAGKQEYRAQAYLTAEVRCPELTAPH